MSIHCRADLEIVGTRNSHLTLLILAAGGALL